MKVVDVIGPLPLGADTIGLIVASCGGKTFPIKSSFGNAEACHEYLNHPISESPSTAFDFMAVVLQTVGIKVSKAKIILANGEPYAVLYVDAGGRVLKVATDNASAGICAALASGVGVHMEEGSVRDLMDSTLAYQTLKGNFGSLWPLQPLTNTHELQAMSEYIDEALPNWSKPA